MEIVIKMTVNVHGNMSIVRVKFTCICSQKNAPFNSAMVLNCQPNLIAQLQNLREHAQN